MPFLYINHSRIPTEKAHGINIVSMCEFFYAKDGDFKLIVPNIGNNIKVSIVNYYGLKSEFPIKKLPTISALRWESILGQLAFWVQFSSFYISVFFYLLFKSRKDTIVYTRDHLASLLWFLGYKVVYECHSIPKKQKVFFSLTRLFYKTVVISAGLQKYFLQQGFKQEKIFIAPDAVKLEKFDIDIPTGQARQKLALPENKKIICYCGKFKTMNMDKGIHDILKSLKYLSEDIIFLAVGGSDKDIEHYQNIVKDLKVDQRVIFIGHVAQGDLAYYQKAADILLMPFPYHKHYAEFMSPIKMFEYMASQKPIVTSDLPTIREVLNENNSLFCRSDNPEDLSKKIKYIFNNPEHTLSIAKQAHKDVQKFSWSNRVQSILDFINI